MYDHYRRSKFDDHQDSKAKRKTLHPNGDFRNTLQTDNSRMPDFTKSTKERKMLQTTNQMLGRTTLRTTGDKFYGEKHAFRTFLGEQEDLPRLSILENHRQIMRIMTNSYIKGIEQERKYRNRDAKDLHKDEEFNKYKEEERNT
jgi:hypothetical protein